MAKNKNKKKRDASVAMDITEQSVSCLPQAMDISETGVQKPGTGAPKISVKKGRPMKRSQNVRKMKSLEKAISKHEKIAEKVTKNENKKLRTQSAKLFTPVLATLLGYVAISKDPFIGGSLLLSYTTGYIAPLLEHFSGALLLGVGLYTFLDKLFPATTAM